MHVVLPPHPSVASAASPTVGGSGVSPSTTMTGVPPSILNLSNLFPTLLGRCSLQLPSLSIHRVSMLLYLKAKLWLFIQMLHRILSLTLIHSLYALSLVTLVCARDVEALYVQLMVVYCSLHSIWPLLDSNEDHTGIKMVSWRHLFVNKLLTTTWMFLVSKLPRHASYQLNLSSLQIFFHRCQQHTKNIYV